MTMMMKMTNQWVDTRRAAVEECDWPIHARWVLRAEARVREDVAGEHEEPLAGAQVTLVSTISQGELGAS